MGKHEDFIFEGVGSNKAGKNNPKSNSYNKNEKHLLHKEHHQAITKYVFIGVVVLVAIALLSTQTKLFDAKKEQPAIAKPAEATPEKIQQAPVVPTCFSAEECEAEKLLVNISELEQPAPESLNFTFCSSSPNPQACFEGYVQQKAVEAKDVGYCLYLLNSGDCIDYYYKEQAIEKANLLLCDKINHYSFKQECTKRVVFRKVVASKDTKYCEVLSGEDKKVCEGLKG